MLYIRHLALKVSHSCSVWPSNGGYVNSCFSRVYWAFHSSI